MRVDWADFARKRFAVSLDSRGVRLMLKHLPNALTLMRLVLAPVIALAIWQAYAVASATGVIVFRDLIMTLARLMSKDGEGARVSKLAKWKTALELVAVGLPILIVATPSLIRMAGLGEDFTAGPEIGQVVMFLWLVLLMVAAFLSVATAVQYALPQKAVAPPPSHNEIEPVETNQLEPGPEGPATLAAPQAGS
jgi:phosphatidylglycerophosphate synthase